MRLHKVWMEEGPGGRFDGIYIDDMLLSGVRAVSINNEVGENPICTIEMFVDWTPVNDRDMEYWSKERMYREEQWKEMMTKKANQLLDDLS